MTRYLAVDLGDKRTGIATGDDATTLVSPLTVLEIPRGDALADALPLHMDGTEGDRVRVARAFGAALATRIDVAIHYQDERLTSHAADRQMAQSGRTHKQKKAIRDALAAAEILRDYLAERG